MSIPINWVQPGLNCDQGTSPNRHQGREVFAPARDGGVFLSVFQGLLGVVLGELESWDFSASSFFTGNLSALSSLAAIQWVLSPLLNEGQNMGVSVTAVGERAVI